MNTETIKSKSVSLVSDATKILKNIQDSFVVRELRGKVADLAFRVTENPYFISLGITPTLLIAVMYIVTGLFFVLFGKRLLKLATFGAGFLFGVFLIFLSSVLFSIEINSQNEIKVLLFLTIAVFSGLYSASMFLSLFSKSFAALFFSTGTLIAYRLASAISLILVEAFGAKYKMVNMPYLRVEGTNTFNSVPVFGFAVLLSIVTMILVALYSIHYLLPLLPILLFALLRYLPIPPFIVENTFSKPFFDSFIGSFDLPLQNFLTAVITAALFFQLVTVFKKVPRKLFLVFVASFAGALLCGAGVEMLFKELRPNLYERMLIFDKGLGFEVSTVSLLAAMFSLLFGTAMQTGSVAGR